MEGELIFAIRVKSNAIEMVREIQRRMQPNGWETVKDFAPGSSLLDIFRMGPGSNDSGRHAIFVNLSNLDGGKC